MKLKFTPGMMPGSFRVERKSPRYNNFIDLELVRGTNPLVWNGWFYEYRISLRWTGNEFVVDVVLRGQYFAIFRWPRKEQEFDDLQKLIQCACDYIERVRDESEI